MVDLLGVIFKNLRDNECIEIDRKSGDGFRAFHFDSVERANNYASSHLGENVFFGVCPRRKPSGTRNEDITRVTVVWADIDAKNFGGDKDRALSMIETAILKPTVIVDSGMGYHPYWCLTNCIEDVSEAVEVLKTVQDMLQSDTVSDPARRLRYPGSMNIKYDPPVECKVIYYEKDNIYDILDIERMTRLPPTIHRLITTGDVSKYKSRSEADFRVVIALKELGYSDDIIRKIWYDSPISSKAEDAYQNGRPYIDHTIENVSKQLVRGSSAPMDFIVANNSYFVKTESGKKQISTFVIEPIKRVIGDGQDQLVCNIHDVSGEVTENYVIPKSAFDSRRDMSKVTTKVNWQWLGSDNQVRSLLPYLLDTYKEEMGTTAAVDTVGYHDGYWVTDECVLTPTGVIDREDAPVIFTSIHDLYPKVRYQFFDENVFSNIVKDIFPRIFDINTPSVSYPIIGWFMATPLKVILFKSGIRFPILNLYGTTGSGKTTTLMSVMQPLIGYRDFQINDCSTTNFSLLSLLSSSISIPVSLSEFRRSSMPESKYSNILRMFLLGYDNSEDARGRADLTVERYKITAPLTVDGEDVISDPAVKERSVIVGMSPDSVMEGSVHFDAFKRIIEMPLRSIAGRYIQHCLSYSDTDISKAWKRNFQLVRDTVNIAIPERPHSNVATVLTGLWALKSFLARYNVKMVEIDENLVTECILPCLSEVISLTAGRRRIAVDEFVEDIINHTSMEDIAKHFYYHIDKETNTVWVQATPAINWWLGDRARQRRISLEHGAIIRQLKERRAEHSDTKGQYVRGPITVDGREVWGFDLKECVAAGLDVPSEVRSGITLKINIPSKN